MFKTILLPTDGSPHADKAIHAALDLAAQTGGRIIALSVVEPYPFPPIAESAYVGGSQAYEQRAEELAQAHVAKASTAAGAAGIPCETVVSSALNPDEEIINVARNYKCDAIVMATHGRRGLDRLFTGSVTQKVIAHAEMPVIVVR